MAPPLPHRPPLGGSELGQPRAARGGGKPPPPRPSGPGARAGTCLAHVRLAFGLSLPTGVRFGRLRASAGAFGAARGGIAAPGELGQARNYIHFSKTLSVGLSHPSPPEGWSQDSPSGSSPPVGYARSG